jgi:hypothetical protein
MKFLAAGWSVQGNLKAEKSLSTHREETVMRGTGCGQAAETRKKMLGKSLFLREAL